MNESFSRCDVSVVDHNKENTDYSGLKFSDILFTGIEDSLGLHFAMKPCLERKTVRTLIERGGGYMSANKHSDQFINLVTNDTKLTEQNSRHKLFYVTFIYDSCKTNTLLDTNQYLLKKTTTIEKIPICEEQAEDEPPKVDNKKVKITSESDEETEEELLIDDYEEPTEKTTDSRQQIEDKQHTEDNEEVMICPDSDEQTEIEDKEELAKSCESQSSVKLKSKDKSVEKEVDKSVDEILIQSESDTDFVEESDDKSSKYFKQKDRFLFQRKPKESDKKKSHFNAYLNYVKQNETINTPENLMRIKKALKMSVKDKKKEPNAHKSNYSLRNTNIVNASKGTSFGSKIVAKTRVEQKTDKKPKSPEIGEQVSDISSDEMVGKDVRLKTTKRVVNQMSVEPKKLISSKPNTLYSLSEDESILEFLVKTKRYDELKGNSLWEEAEKVDICGGRSWQSMKERFRKQIMPNIDSYDITKKDKQRLKVGFYSEKDLETTRGQTATSFTHEEDMALIKAIISNNGYDLVKGTVLWRQIEGQLKSKKANSRSWQSLKERYIKRIVPNLYKYDIKLDLSEKLLSAITSLSESDKKQILNKCKKHCIQMKSKVK